jgi:hypothetical protein
LTQQRENFIGIINIKTAANIASYVYRNSEKDHIIQSYFLPIVIGMKAGASLSSCTGSSHKVFAKPEAPEGMFPHPFNPYFCGI